MTNLVATPPATSAQIQNPQSKIQNPTILIVLALTVLAGILRFLFLDRPSIWGDEAMTYMRVSGTYRQMLEALRDWGFAPLHYELYWVMRQITNLTPFMMRLPTAIAGTLMVPVMYWLAMQLAGQKVGIVAALLTATSAYMCNYSRDAKMYMDFWFFMALNFACLLWWLRVRTRIAWWSWVASGVAMMGLNLLGGLVLGIQVLALIVYPGGQWRNLGSALLTRDLFLLGVFIMLLGPIGYYRYFNRYAEKVDQGGLARGGLGWVEGYNRGRHAGDLVLFTTTAHLYSWEWPRQREQDEINPKVLRGLKVAGITIISLLGVGLLPWPRRWTGFAPRFTDPAPHEARMPFWIPTLIISAWIVLPTSAVYCMSVRGHPSPLAILTQLAAIRSALGLTLVAVGIAFALVGVWFCGENWRQRLYKVGMIALIAVVLFILMTAIYYILPIFYKHRGSVWMPRYLGIIWPAVATAVAALLLRLPTRPLRWGAIVFLVALNLAVFSARVFAGSEPPTGLMAQDLLDSQPDDATVRMYYGIRPLMRGDPGSGMLTSVPGAYYLTILSGQPTTPNEMLRAFANPRFGNFKRWGSGLLPLANTVANDVRRNPQLRTIIVWDRLNRGKTDDSDAVAEKLGPSWRRVDERLFPVRDHWTWRDLLTARRRVYERTDEPASQPATSLTRQAV